MNILQAGVSGGYSSDLEETKKQPLSLYAFQKDPLAPPTPKGASAPIPAYDKVQSSAQRSEYYRQNILGLDAYSRHKKFINNYVLFYGKSNLYTTPTQNTRTDYDVLRDSYRFIRRDDDNDDTTWEKRLAKKYYDKLFKEYCIADMTHYKQGKVGMRWRTEKEVIDGKGQFMCGNKTCEERSGLKSYEVNFAYMEEKQKKSALVKLRLCNECAQKLFYKSNKEKAKQLKKEAKKQRKHKHSDDDGDSNNPKRSKPIDDTTADQTPQSNTNTTVTSTTTTNAETAGNVESIAGGDDLWKAKAQADKTKHDEFDDYFRELFP